MDGATSCEANGGATSDNKVGSDNHESTDEAKVITAMKQSEINNVARIPLSPTDRNTMTPSTDLSVVRAVSPFNEADTCAILRQVEFYFSDQNLPGDRHLLSLAGGDGNGPVSINEICSFKRMRGFKPRSAVKEVLKQSAVLDIVGKKLKRHFPLTVSLRVEPKIDMERANMEKTLADNPHLTKNMIKPTGFETGFSHYPVTRQEHERDLQMYDPELSFWSRVENALAHYCSKRKMHQKTKRVFDLWMSYGGVISGSSPFSNGLQERNNEDLDKNELARFKYQYTVDPLVLQEEEDWEVDFEATSLGFLSTEFLSWFDWGDDEEIDNACNVMKNFFNFLLQHDVCPEYANNIKSARHSIDLAATELRILHRADKELCHPHSFAAACSRLQSADHERCEVEWDNTQRADEARATLTPDEALSIIFAGITAHGSQEQIDLISADRLSSARLDIAGLVTAEAIGLEIVGIEPAEGQRAEFFRALDNTIVPAMGIMHCKRWKRPYEPIYDRPCTTSRLPATFDFIVNQKALLCCSIGMKLDVQVMMTASGLYWIDELYNLHPSFYLWLPNTRMSEIKQRIKDQDEVHDFLRQNEQWIQGTEGLHVYATTPS